MEKGFTEEDIEEYESAFRVFDKDGDGFINAKDLVKVMRDFGENLTEAEAEDTINAVDADENGVIDFNEFLNFMARREKSMKSRESEEEHAATFELFDTDQDGFISLADLRDALAKVGEKTTDDELEEMIGNADADGDGQLNYEEFVRAMVKLQ